MPIIYYMSNISKSKDENSKKTEIHTDNGSSLYFYSIPSALFYGY